MPTHQIIPQYQVQSFSSGNVAAAVAAAVAPAVVGKTWYTTGLLVTGSGPTTASAILATLAGLLNGTLSFVLTPLAGILLNAFPNGQLSIPFTDPLPASATNTAVTFSVPSLGSGSTNCVATIFGFYA